MKILVTGAAGFIGAAVAQKLLSEGDDVTGVDNLNDYYDPELKKGRLALLGINDKDISWGKYIESKENPGFRFVRLNLDDREATSRMFKEGEFDIVIHLAAQPGVRYSISNPAVYIESNISGFLNVLEGCRETKVDHLVFASSSSV